MSTSPYRPLDFLALDADLEDDERIVRDTVRNWVSERLMPEVIEHFEAGTFPRHFIPELAELGILGCNLPEEYGCAGLNNVCYGLVCRELERGDSGLRSFYSVQGSLVMWPILTFGSEAQKNEWLPRLAAGEAIGCFGLTEPDFGSNPGGMQTTAKRDGDDWILNGRKMWITNGSFADVAVVWARSEDGFRGFLVPTDTPGFSAPLMKHKWSLCMSVTSELILDDVRLPAEAELPKGTGLSAPLTCLTQARFGISWGVVGAAMACYDEALRYTSERTVFDKKLAGYQLPQKKLADIATAISLDQLLVLRLGRLKDEGRMTHPMVSMAKRRTVKSALEIARTVRDMLGANGISLEYQVGRHMLNLESVITYEGTDDIHALAVGNELTGIQAFR
jgi:glutaryl-CoA dehydrogenase